MRFTKEKVATAGIATLLVILAEMAVSKVKQIEADQELARQEAIAAEEAAEKAAEQKERELAEEERIAAEERAAQAAIPLTFPKEIKEKVRSNMPGLLAIQAVNAMYADSLTETIMPIICDISGDPDIPEDAAKVMTAYTLQQKLGYDDQKALNFADGLVTTPGLG